MSKPLMIVALEDNENSYYALQWTLQHFFHTSRADWAFSLLILHARRPAVDSLSTINPAAGSVVTDVDSDLKRKATRVTVKAKETCEASLIKDVEVEVVEGTPEKVLCEAVERHHASVLVVGSQGRGAIERFFKGSVSGYCAKNAQCSVMIVKKPKD